MMEAARTSETLVNFYQTTRRYKPEDSHLRTHRRENLKSYLALKKMRIRILIEFIELYFREGTINVHSRSAVFTVHTSACVCSRSGEVRREDQGKT
jgi:hypothetical protein